jgi:hypothetical protein
MPVVGTLLLFSIDGDFCAVHIQHHPPWCIHGGRLRQQFPIDSAQTFQVLILGQHLGLEPMQARRQRCPTLPDLLGADQAEGRILRQPLRVVHIFVSCQATVDGLSQRVREWQLRVLSLPSVQDVFGDERTQSQTFIQLAHHKQTTVRGDARTLEINFQRRVKRELKGLILFLTHWVEPPRGRFHFPSRMNAGIGAIIQPLTQSSKRKCGFRYVQPRCSLNAIAEHEREFREVIENN